MAALGLCCCMWAFSSCGELGLLSIAVHGVLIVVVFLCCKAWALAAQASVVVARGLRSCGARALLLCGMWDLPRPRLEPVSPALAGGFLTIVPPGNSYLIFLLGSFFGLWLHLNVFFFNSS